MARKDKAQQTQQTEAMEKRDWPDLITAANKGDKTALAELRELARTTMPGLWRELWRRTSGVERALIERLSKDDLMKNVLEHRLADLKNDLAGPDPTPIERLLAERAALCWLQSFHEDAMVPTLGEHSMREGEYWSRRAERAQRRYLSALRTLAVVRRLQVPTVIAMANQQINLIGDGGAK